MTDNNRENNGRGDWHDAASGRFKPGNPGRQPGSKNKLRDKVRLFLNDNWEQLPTWFAALKEKEKIDVMLSLLPYSLPRLQSITTVEGEDPREPLASFDYTKLSPGALKELLSLTTINDETSS